MWDIDNPCEYCGCSYFLYGDNNGVEEREKSCNSCKFLMHRAIVLIWIHSLLSYCFIPFFLQKLSLDYTERHSRPRKLSTPMSYLADHTGCRGRADLDHLHMARKDTTYIRLILVYVNIFYILSFNWIN